MGNLWNDTDRAKELYSEKTLSQCCFVHHKATCNGLELNPDLFGEKPAINVNVMTVICS